MSHLRPDRHSQRDFFVADLLDASPKDDLASMEHPLFALKAGDRRVRSYERNGNTIEIRPGIKGLATIHDKDVWIYCISHLVEAINRGREDVGRTVRFTAYDFLVTTNRRTDGDSYKRTPFPPKPTPCRGFLAGSRERPSDEAGLAAVVKDWQRMSVEERALTASIIEKMERGEVLDGYAVRVTVAEFEAKLREWGVKP